jgi:predicted RNA binding protein YcfA (HicA-like mRNA interferase family)
MGKLPQVSGDEAVRRLKRLGMVEDHSKGGHVILRNPATGKLCDVPLHGSKDLKKGTLNAILKQLSVDRDDFANA